MKYSNIHNYSYVQPLEKGFYTIEGQTILFSDKMWEDLSKVNVNDLWLTSLIYLSKDFESNDIDQAYKVYISWRKRYSTPKIRSKDPESYCWNEISVTARLFVLSFLYLKKQKKELLQDIINHLEWLITEENYVGKHNHGQYQDIAIVKFFNEYGSFFNIIPDKYIKIANKRFTESISHSVSKMGVHLEHSSAYHFTILRLINTFLTNNNNPSLSSIRDKMKFISKLYVYPDTTLPQLGDTYRTKGYHFVKKNQLFFDKEAGIIIYRSSKWDLFFTCWHHSHTHKHSDELNFELSYNDNRVFVDSGNYGFNYNDNFNKYARSLAGHNCLKFKDFDYNAKNLKPYGSGMLYVLEINNGLIGIGYNPHLLKKGILHVRIIEITERSFFVSDYINHNYNNILMTETNFHLEDSIKTKKTIRNKFMITVNKKNLYIFFGHGSQSIGRYHFDKEKTKGIYFPSDNIIAANNQFVLEDKVKQKEFITSSLSESNNVNHPTYNDGIYISSDTVHTININDLIKNFIK
ncbi:heparinase II/III family protein [uncultured Shewanella sp.]|uniref:heparinase II/III domain-containing protein n=1 Tax=uncultured Shewanella sp. TaxID=173975 RepID=UPI0026100530|nr:heparinase II/III family protein [uncultured Shewanella sp.]